MSNAVKNFDDLATSLNVLHNNSDSSAKFFFLPVSSKNFRSFSKIVLSVYSWNQLYFLGYFLL